jgi:hypothetical protein
MKKIIIFSLLMSCSLSPSRDLAMDKQTSPFHRQYQDGEILKYRIQMTHTLDGVVTSTYDARALSIVKKDRDGYYEEFQWTSVIDDGKKAPLTKIDKAFRQILSLVPPYRLSVPAELPTLSRYLIGPVTDLLTFYVDESLLTRQESLRKSGDHIYLKTSAASSWGTGQDCLDFDITLLNINEIKKMGSFRVSHLPPSKICISPPAPWMETQVTDTPNNWFDIEHKQNKWIASFGKETFDVDQQVDLSNGIILSATMHNPVVFQSRECVDEKLLNCSLPTNHMIVRNIKFLFE